MCVVYCLASWTTKFLEKKSLIYENTFQDESDDPHPDLENRQIPAEYVLNPKEILYLGENFLVPNPPEEYLRLKYGAEWKIPKRAGQYEIDVVKKIPDQSLTGDPAWIRVLDVDGQPVYGAEVSLAGGTRATTDESGTAEIILPCPDFYALTITYPGHQQVLYMEDLLPHKKYIYREITESNSSDVGTLGNVLSMEQ